MELPSLGANNSHGQTNIPTNMPPAVAIPAMIATSYRYIVRVPGVRSGNPVIEGTRLGVHDVVAVVQTGASVDEVVASFPSLSRAQVL